MLCLHSERREINAGASFAFSFPLGLEYQLKGWYHLHSDSIDLPLISLQTTSQMCVEVCLLDESEVCQADSIISSPTAFIQEMEAVCFLP